MVAQTLSSTKTFPFFFPFGFSTPIGVIIFNAGISNSFSVYTFLLFFNVGRLPALFCGFGGRPLPFGFLDFETPSFSGLELDLLFLIPDLFVACFDFTVDVREGAIVSM